MESSEERNFREEILAQYRPFIDKLIPFLGKLRRSLAEKGEAQTLKELINTGENRQFKELCRIFILHDYDFSNMSPESLVRTLEEVTDYVYLRFSVWISIKHGWEPPDLGLRVPQDLLGALLKKPSPFIAFFSAMFSSQLFSLCMEEIEGRGLKHPELMAELDFAYSQSNKRAKVRALLWRQKKS